MDARENPSSILFDLLRLTGQVKAVWIFYFALLVHNNAQRFGDAMGGRPASVERQPVAYGES